MMFEKELTPDQINAVKRLGQIKQKLPPEKWTFLKMLMLTYIDDITMLSLPSENTTKAKI